MDQENLDDINDENTLRQMLEQSEDLEFRRRIRARIRQIKKETGTTEETKPVVAPTSNPAKIQTHQSAADKEKSVRINDSKPGNDPENKELIQAFSAGLKKSANPNVSNNKDVESTKMKLETVTLRSSRSRDVADGKDLKETGSGRTTFESPTLRQVGQTRKPTENLPTKITVSGVASPKQAFAKFKEIDSVTKKSDHLGATDDCDSKKTVLGNSRRSPSPSSIKEQTLNWCKARVADYENVEIVDFSSSWNDGLAFCALIHSFYPEAFDYDELDPKNRKKNFQLAFDTAEKLAGLAPLLEADDMARISNPDWRCVFTYVNSLATRIAEIRKERRQQEEENEQKTA